MRGEQRYRYDPEGRLRAFETYNSLLHDHQLEKYQYDPADNLLDVDLTYAANDDLRAKPCLDNRIYSYQKMQYRYDDFGRLKHHYNASENLQFYYDGAQQLSSVLNNNPAQACRVQYEYDALGRRSEKILQYLDAQGRPKNEPILTQFIWMGMQMIQENRLNHGDLRTFTYIYRPDGSYEPLAQIVQTAYQFISNVEILNWQNIHPALLSIESKENEKYVFTVKGNDWRIIIEFKSLTF